jgi:glycogen phosphorylase
VIAGRMVRDYVTEYYEPAAIGTNTMTDDAAWPARELAGWKQRVEAAWPDVSVRLLDDDSSAGGGAAGQARVAVVELDPGTLDREEIVVQVLHGPLATDGTFDETQLTIVPMTVSDDGRFRATFVPDRAGRWGIAARAMPTHPHLTGPFDTGLVTVG